MLSGLLAVWDGRIAAVFCGADAQDATGPRCFLEKGFPETERSLGWRGTDKVLFLWLMSIQFLLSIRLEMYHSYIVPANCVHLPVHSC